MIAGIIISGGYRPGARHPVNSTEVWIPSSGLQCRLADLPAGRAEHSQSGDLLCGGLGQARELHNSCVRWRGRVWTTWAVLQTVRVGHSAWNSSAGLVLMGGDITRKSTEIVKGKNRVEKYFPMKYQTK